MSPGVSPLARLPTGVPGFDEISGGGLFEGGVYIVRGDTGAGKTIFVNQICFHAARQGRRAVYISLLAEAHERLLAQLSGLAFFDEALLVSHLTYLNGYQLLTGGGIEALRHAIQRVVGETRASLLVLDGLETIECFTRVPAEFKQFVNVLQGYSTIAKCSMLAVSAPAGETFHPEFTVADGLIFMQYKSDGRLRGVRELMIQKLRGSRLAEGRHSYEISDRGITIFPRLESRPIAGRPVEPGRLSLGGPVLDEMTQGGVSSGSSTLLLGAPGSGKTILGLQFLAAGCAAGERALYFGFYEPPQRILAKGDAIGLGLSALEAQHLLAVQWVPPLEVPLDEVAVRVLDAVAQGGVRRVFIDGIEGMLMAAVYPERLPTFLTALVSHLRDSEATVFFSGERHPQGSFGEGTIEDVAAVVENIFGVRYVEVRARLFRLFSILKMRDHEYDTSAREFFVSSRGITLADSARSAESILGGAAPARRAGRRRG